MSLAIDGLASGLDTTNIVNQLMEIERRPIRLLEVRQSEMQQRMDAWRDVNSRLNRLDNLMADLARSSTYEGRKATSSDAAIVTATAANRADPAVYNVHVQQLATTHRIASDERAEGADQALALSGEVKINGKKIDVSVDMSLRDFAKAVNEADAGVRATIIADRLVLESTATGTEGALEWTGDDEKGLAGDLGIWTDLGVLKVEGEENPVEIKHQLQEAKDAIFTVNGVKVERSSNTVSDVIEGLTFHLHEEGTSVITVAQDVDGAISRVQAFVDQYNSAMEFMRDKLGEGAILQGDSTLVRLQMGLRQAVLDRVGADGTLNQLAQVGITSTREGRLEFDQAKFREAFQEDPVAVKELFAGDGDGDQGGAIGRARGFLKSYIESRTGVIAGRQEMLDGQVKSIKDNIERMEDRLERRSERLYRQFTAMEQALAQLQSQSNWLQMQLMHFVPATRGQS